MRSEGWTRLTDSGEQRRNMIEPDEQKCGQDRHEYLQAVPDGTKATFEPSPALRVVCPESSLCVGSKHCKHV